MHRNTKPIRLATFLALVILGHIPAFAADWDDVKVPANPGPNMTWRLLDISDDFAYTAPPVGKPKPFTDRWKEGFINGWLGPGLTEWNPGHSYVTNGHLGIAASRKSGTKKVYLGCISSKAKFEYPLFVETKMKMSNQVLASNVWMLSSDSTQEIDVHEAYGSNRKDQEHFAKRIHLSHHVFIRQPFQDYQPTDDGSWFSDGTTWQEGFHRVGVYWKDPWNLEYYVDGNLARTVSGPAVIDPKNYTGGTGLNKAMHIIVNMEDQGWRSDQGITATDEELADTSKSIMWVDWVRVYQAVEKWNYD